MKFFGRSFLFATWMSCALLTPVQTLKAAEEVQEPSTKRSFPSEISFTTNGTNYNLNLTGVALRKKFIVNVYAVGHYMQNPPTEGNVYEKILNDNKAKALKFQYVHNITQQQIRDAYIDSLHKTLSESEFTANQQQIDRFLSFFDQDIKINDTSELRWLPDNTIEVVVNGKTKGMVQNPTFAKALWSIWLGPRSIVKRDNLVSLLEKP